MTLRTFRIPPPPGARPVVFSLLPALLLLACQGEREPELLSVHRLDPARAALSDRITITGEGFPEGRDATVSFRGDLFRPGAPSQHDVRIAAHALPSGRNALTLLLDAPLEKRFVGAGENAVHTTFHGDVRVSFRGSGASTAVSGTAHDVVFDVLPSAAADADSMDKEAATILSALGMSVTTESSGVGL